MARATASNDWLTCGTQCYFNFMQEMEIKWSVDVTHTHTRQHTHTPTLGQKSFDVFEWKTEEMS